MNGALFHAWKLSVIKLVFGFGPSNCWRSLCSNLQNSPSLFYPKEAF